MRGWNRTNRNRTIAGMLVMLMVAGPFGQTAHAATISNTTAVSTPTTTLEISAQDAVDLAMENNDSIKTAALNKENAELTQSIGQKQYAQAVVEGPKYNSFEQDGTLYGMKVNDLTSDIYDLSYDLTKESVEVGVRQLYWGIILQKSAIEVAEAQLAYAEQQYKMTELKKTVGMLTQTQVEQAKAGVESAKATLTAAQGNLETSINTLKKTMGVKGNVELILDETLPEYAPIDISNLEQYTNRMVLNAPTLKIQEKTVEATKYGADANKLQMIANMIGYEVFNKDINAYVDVGGVTYSQKDKERQTEISTDTAKINKEVAEKNLRDTVHALYYDALTLEANYSALQQSMVTAEAALATRQQMYDLGMITSLELLEAKNQYVTLEDNYKKAVIGHAIDALKLEHPWVGQSSQRSE